MQKTRALLLTASCIVAAVVGCGDIIGLDGYTEGDGSIADATGSDGGGNDAGVDGCASPGFTCVPSLPSGWAWAIYDPAARPTCAAGYTTPKDVEEGIDAGAAACGCTCTTTDPSCATGKVTITAGNNGLCNNVTNQNDVADAGCNGATTFTTTGDSISVIGPAPAGGSCTPTPTESAPAVGYANEGRTCTYTGSPGGGCANGNVCLPNPAPFTTCVAHAGMNACPSGFATQHLVGSAITDTRGCTACTCDFDAGTCGGTATLYTNAGCTTGAQAIPVDAKCTAVGNHTWKGYSYVPTTNDSCTASSVSPDGGVVFSDLTTICCN